MSTKLVETLMAVLAFVAFPFTVIAAVTGGLMVLDRLTHHHHHRHHHHHV